MRRCTLLTCLWLPSAHVMANDARVATIQFTSLDGAFEENLRTASELLAEARAWGADIALLPEFSLIGYRLSPDMWRDAEPANGRTTATLARELNLHIGTSYLEVDGEDLYNSY